MAVYNMRNVKTGEIVASFTNISKARDFFMSNLMVELEVISRKPRFFYDTDNNKEFYIHPIGKPTILVGVCQSEAEAKKYVEWCNKNHF